MRQWLRLRLRQWLFPTPPETSTPRSMPPDQMARLELRVQTVEDEVRVLREAMTPTADPVRYDSDAHLGAH